MAFHYGVSKELLLWKTIIITGGRTSESGKAPFWEIFILWREIWAIVWKVACLHREAISMLRSIRHLAACEGGLKYFFFQP